MAGLSLVGFTFVACQMHQMGDRLDRGGRILESGRLGCHSRKGG